MNKWTSYISHFPSLWQLPLWWRWFFSEKKLPSESLWCVLARKHRTSTMCALWNVNGHVCCFNFKSCKTNVFHFGKWYKTYLKNRRAHWAKQIFLCSVLRLTHQQKPCSSNRNCTSMNAFAACKQKKLLRNTQPAFCKLRHILFVDDFP